jgi:hypothetical protein
MTHPRDGVRGLDAETDSAIVSVSDVYGYLGRARSALRAVGDRPAFDPLVETDDDGCLHWTGNDYVLVFNGDLVDRGPDSRGVLDLAQRLREEAPEWRVRYNLGNHEAALLWPSPPDHDRWFADRVTDKERREFYRLVLDGAVTVAYRGYEYTFVHAGTADSLDLSAANDELVEAAATCINAVGTDDDRMVHRRAFEEHAELLWHGGEDDARGRDAGLLWLDFEHLPGTRRRRSWVTRHTSSRRARGTSSVATRSERPSTRRAASRCWWRPRSRSARSCGRPRECLASGAVARVCHRLPPREND